jgi:PAS domain S-box-containing protein
MLTERSERAREPLRRDQIESARSNSELASEYQFSPVPQVTLDRNGCIRRMNTAATVRLKGELSQLFKVPFITFVEKSYCHIFLDHLFSCLRSRKRSSTQLVLASYTRATGPVELQSLPGVDRTSGELLCRTAIVSRSATQLDNRQKVSQSRSYGELFDLSPGAVIVHVAGKIVDANRAAVKLLATESADRLWGRDLYELIQSDFHQLVRDRMSRLERGEVELPVVEEKFVRLDGQVVAVNVLSRRTTFQGKPATMTLARDLSKDVELKEDLLRTKALAEQILAHNSIATAIVSLETGRLLMANEVLCSLAGLDQGQIAGRSLLEIGWNFTAGDQQDFIGRLDSQKSIQNCEARIRRPDGNHVEVVVSGKAILFGSERAMLLMVQDLTDLRRLQQDVVTIAEEEQRRFSRDLHDSHCQDLTAIAFFAETIAATLNVKDVESANQVRALGQMVRKSAENVHTLAAGHSSQQIEQSGLRTALKQLAARTTHRFGLICTAKTDRKCQIGDTALAVHLYRIAQEATSNAAKHSCQENRYRAAP